MRIDTLALKGITCFTKPIVLDLRDVPPGLVAVVGRNYSGKTTLMESMVAPFYRQFLSRGEILNYATDRDSYLDVTASFDGQGSYRARLNLDGVKRTSDAVLEHVADGRREMLNDGKVTTFDAAIAKVFPPLSLLLASAFAAQNKAGSFVRLDKKARKDLFATLLGLDHYEAMATTARTAALTVERRLDELRGQIAYLAPRTTEAEAERFGQIGNDLHVAQADQQEALRAAQNALATLEAQIVDARRVASAYATATVALAALETRATDLRRQADAIAKQLADVDAEEGRELAQIARRRQSVLADLAAQLTALPSPEAIDATLQTQIKQIKATYDAKAKAIEAKIAECQGLCDRAAELRAAGVALDDLEADEATSRATLREATVLEVELLPALREAQRHVTLEQEWPYKLEAANCAAGLIETVPFGEKCAAAGCQFVQQAVTARGQLGVFRAGVARLEAAQAVLVSRQGDLEALQSGLARIQSLLQALSARIRTEHSQTRENLIRLDAADRRVTELVVELGLLEAEAGDLCQQETARSAETAATTAATRLSLQTASASANQLAAQERAELLERGVTRRAELEHQRQLVTAAGATLEADRGRAEATVATHAASHAALLDAEVALAGTRTRASDAAVALSRLEAEIQAFERNRHEFRERLHEREQLEVAATALETDLIEWQALAKVLGRDGLPVLEIDAAGPGVSALANDLLEACFGSRFQVELVTQEVKATGKGFKDAFTLRVFDNERGGEPRDLIDLSGGEQVIVDEAIKSSLATYVNQRNVLPIRTIWRDETSGALDPDNSVRYINMLRRLHAKSVVHHLFYVSQSPETSALADVQIVVKDGTAMIMYPPFQEAS